MPNSLIFIYFGRCFEQNIDNLPDSIRTIILPPYYNKPINKLPNSLKILVGGIISDKIKKKYPQINFVVKNE